MSRILLAEDDGALRKSLALCLRDQGHEVVEVPDGAEAIERLSSEIFDLVLTDSRMPQTGGHEVLRFAKTVNESTAVIVMTAYPTVETAVEAMKLGADDYVQKPFELAELELKVARALEHRRLVHENAYLRHERGLVYDFANIIGDSPAIQRVIEVVKKVAASNATVLITGETGTGKELIAGAIHYNSPRRQKSFVKVNCAALPENLLESELFGHEKGAFTGADRQRIGRFEQASGGTLFLDEVGDMTPSTQAKVLRVLQEQEFERLGGTKTIKVDVRILAATNKDLAEAVQAGQFREDLYYRLNVVSVKMPPLRERKADILPLARYFVRQCAGEVKKRVSGFEPAAIKLLMRYHWPGNIRELRNAIERAVLMTDGPLIRAADLALGDHSVERTGGEGLAIRIPPEGIRLVDVERQLIVEALKICNWVQKDAAELLGISRRVINYKIAAYGITNPRWTRNRGARPGGPPADPPG
ncbi:MAG TPA: sigma-54 dependent transcriptional regulator, partial [Thermodesulfobacteriota bacterium]|nr:sigma-54 dependent transcriptional regulator [Thermodesulfobacteriota bacterium]